MNLTFILKRIGNTNIRGFIDTAKEVSKITGKSWVSVLMDILDCTKKYGSGRVDYITFEMYNMSDSERAKLLTIGKNNELTKKYNDPTYIKYFDDKGVFNKKFDKFLKRDWMIIDGNNLNEFKEFISNKSSIVVKPLNLSCGTGIEKIDLDDSSNIESIYNRLYEAKKYLIEEIVVQNKEMATLCSTSVNTIRLLTIVDNGKPHLVAGAVRMGREGNFVDNFDFGGYEANIGGFAVTLDTSKGVVITDPIDKHRNVYPELPVLGTHVKGFKIPMWDEVVKLVLDAAMVVPQIGYVGWDISISADKGPLIIEGNNYPAQDFIQQPKLGIGTYDAIIRIINNDE